MSREVCPLTGKPYGVKRVCKTLGKARSTHYERKARAKRTTDAPVSKRGPKTTHSDDQVLLMIRDYIATSWFKMEGYRKVWADFKHVRGLRIGKHRVLRIMRENRLLSPLRQPWREKKPHDGTILSEKPNVMWGTDGTQVYTIDDGKWLDLRGARSLHRGMRWIACLQDRQSLRRAGTDQPGRDGALRIH